MSVGLLKKKHNYIFSPDKFKNGKLNASLK